MEQHVGRVDIQYRHWVSKVDIDLLVDTMGNVPGEKIHR